MARTIGNRREPASAFLGPRKKQKTVLGGTAGRGQAARDRAAAANRRLQGQLPEAPQYLAGKGFSLQPEGFETSLGVARGLDRVPQRTGIAARQATARGRVPGSLFDPDTPGTLLSGRIRRTKNTPGGVARGPEMLEGGEFQLPTVNRDRGGFFKKVKKKLKGGRRDIRRALPLDRVRQRQTILGTDIRL